MPSARRFALMLAAILASGAAMAQEGQPRFSADQLKAILKPAELTRGLTGGEGPEPGAEGSSVVPNLGILFSFNSAELTPEARAQLDELGAALQSDDLRGFRFDISGHTDAIGGDGFNKSLSQRRADAVVAYLGSNFGIPRERLKAIGYGKADLADPANPTSGVNRRVQVRTEP